MTKFTKTNLIAEVKKITYLQEKVCKDIVDMVFSTIKANAKKGKVKISGLGVFEVKKTKPRKGRNLQTGEVCIIDEREKFCFKASRKLKTNMQEDI